MIDVSIDSQGIATLSWNVANRPMNVMNNDSMAAYAEAVERVIKDAAVIGVIVTSTRREFVAGADLTAITKSSSAQQLFDWMWRVQQLFRAIEKSGKPFVAAINGSALGGGYEVALACHHRIAADVKGARIGLPESTLGLLPGAGGTQRLPRMIGLRAALPILLEGKTFSPADAFKNGLVDELVPLADLQARAKTWLLEQGAQNTVKPWDQKGFKIPGGAVQSPVGYETFLVGNAMTREKTYGNYPAAKNILSCVYEGLQTDIDTGLRIETRYFVNCAGSSEAKAMIRTLFFGMNDAKKLSSRPQDIGEFQTSKVAILGAGMMGAAIAYVCAQAGYQVVLLDSSREKADEGKAYSANLLQKRVAQGRMNETDRDAFLARIKPTADYADLMGAGLVIEAVFEDRALKAEVTKKAEAVLPQGILMASNTSTLPISGLAEASREPGRFIGLHFFSPADKMPLVEVIRGRATTDETLAHALDFVKRIGKTPVVVNDSRGFYTSRVFATYVNEGISLLAEGVAPALIDNAGRMAGMPVGPLALADEVALDLIWRIKNQTKADLGSSYKAQPADEVIDLMVEKLGRLGKKAGRGFYDYPQDGGRKRIWAGLAQHFPVRADQPNSESVKRRLMYIQSIETLRCIEEGVVTRPMDADVGAILGWGFSPHLGGPIGQIDAIGAKAFVEQCEVLAREAGQRFSPPAKLLAMAKAGEAFYPA